MFQKWFLVASSGNTVVEHLTSHSEIKGLNPVTAWHQEKMAKVPFNGQQQ